MIFVQQDKGLLCKKKWALVRAAATATPIPKPSAPSVDELDVCVVFIEKCKDLFLLVFLF